MTAQAAAKSQMAERSARARRSPRGSLAILAVGELLTRAMSFLAFAHLARTLGPDGFGKLEFVLAWVMFGMMLIESGFQTIGARDVAIDEGAAATLVSRILPIQISIAAAICMSCFVLQLTGWLDAGNVATAVGV